MLLRAYVLLGLMPLLLLFGCASTPDDYRDPRDPWEPYNRAVTRFNEDFDRDIFKPVARGYKTITPAPVNKGITNFFGNISDVVSALNNLLQLKLTRAVSDVGRVVVNSTLGVLGFVDVASNLNLEKYGEDFGQTLGYWGVGPGPYFVLPLLGPNDLRDTLGLVVDWKTNPLGYLHLGQWRIGLTVLKVVDKRADLLGASAVLEEAALDPYEFLRDAYLQKRLNDVYDGNPPEEEFDFEDEFEGEDERDGEDTEASRP